MNINNEFSTQVEHNKVQATHQCTFEDCKKSCKLCVQEGINNNGLENQNTYQKLPQMDKQEDKTYKKIDFSNKIYNLKKIDENRDTYTFQISNNEKYLVYGGLSKLKIYDIQENKIIKEISIFEVSIFSCQFTYDSSQLFVGFSHNQSFFSVLIGYDVKRNFKKKFQQNIYAYYIENIITIQNQYLMISRYGSNVVKLDITRRKQLFHLFSYHDSTNAIDYNQSNNLLICGCKDKFIKLWHCGKRKIIINKGQAHFWEIQQIQFINNIQNVLSLDCKYNLYKWIIDLNNNDLIKLQEYKDPKNIYSFCKINQNYNLLLICGYYIKIIDDKGETIYQIDHQCGQSDYLQLTNRQLDNARFIITASESILLSQKKKKSCWLQPQIEMNEENNLINLILLIPIIVQSCFLQNYLEFLERYKLFSYYYSIVNNEHNIKKLSSIIIQYRANIF